MNQQRPSTSQFRPTPGVFNSGSPYGAGGVSQPPPLPPRRMTSLYQNPYGGGYRTSMYGGNYGGYGGYGLGNTYAYGSPYGNYGYSHGPSGDAEHRFVQFAEESSRPAFQSIESIVQTFSSITMMLESTFFAMTSSFRAILNVAESIGRVRSMFGQLLSTFALIRFVKWLYRKIMYQLGLRPDDPNADAVWQRTVLDVVNGGTAGPATWPILVFLGLLFAIPYLINKLVNNASQNRIDVRNPEDWFKANEPVYSATAAYDFVAATSEEMSLRAGQKIWLAPESLQPKNMPGWQRATDSVNVGLVPSNYITIVGQLKRKTELNDDDTKKIEKQKIDRTMDEAFLISNETDGSTQDSIANES